MLTARHSPCRPFLRRSCVTVTIITSTSVEFLSCLSFCFFTLNACLYNNKKSHLWTITDFQPSQILSAFRTALSPGKLTGKAKHPKAYPIPDLDVLVTRNFHATKSAPLAITGRHLPLIYTLISTLVSSPHDKTVLVLDTEHRFDATRLICSPDNVRHVYVHRPARRGIPGHHGGSSVGTGPEQVRELVAAAENWMLYGDHASRSREWWGTIVIGALGAGDVTAAWKGWLRIDRDTVPGFSLGCSAKEAMTDRQRRQEAVDVAPWAASSQWGSFTFTESGASATAPSTDSLHATS